MKPNKLALFDCDGTIIDSQHDIVAAMHGAFNAEGLKLPTREAILAIVGLSLPAAMARLLPEADDRLCHHLGELYKSSFRTLREAGHIGEPLYPGVAELIHTLYEEGWMLGVATGKSDRGLQICLTNHGLIDRFVTLQTADRHPSKPHPSMALQAIADAGAAPETTIMIGDTSYDMALAHNAGTRALGVTWGYHSAEELRESGAHAIAVDMEELARHIRAHDFA